MPTVITGDNNDNVLVETAGDDVIDGQGGNDTVTYAASAAGVTANLATGLATGDGSDTFTSIENLTGSAFADTLTGDAGANVILGGGGDDTLNGGLGNDTLDGGAGINTASYADATSKVSVNLFTTAQQDTLGAGLDTLVNIQSLIGSDYDDLLQGGGILQGGLGNDTFVGAGVMDGGSSGGYVGDLYYSAWQNANTTIDLSSAAAQTIFTGFAYPTVTFVDIESLTTGNGNDVLTGNARSNYFNPNGGDDTVNGGAGYDSVDYVNATVGVTVNLNLQGAPQATGQGADTLISIERVFGSQFDDTLTGDAGDNGFSGGAGTNVIDGGGGFDWVSYSGATSGVTVDLSNTGVQDTGFSHDQLLNIEMVIGSSFNDHLIGSSGDDVLAGAGGDDILDGAGGNNAVSYNEAPHPLGVVVDLSQAGPQDTVGAGIDTLISIENINGSNFNDVLTGDGAANELNGWMGDDIINGGGGDDLIRGDANNALNQDPHGSDGNDTLHGEAGDDTLMGGGGDDTLDGGADTDTADYSEAGGAIVANLLTGVATGDGTDTLIAIENLTGSALNDTLTGNTGANLLTGGDGNDTLEGGDGDDTLDGGLGADTASYAGASAGVTVSLALAGAQNTIGAGIDTLISIENLTGSAFADTLTGDTGNNVINGGGGDDTLNGGLGNDALDGGAGVNTASYADATSKVSVSLFTTAQQDTLGAGLDTLTNIQNLIGSDYDDTLQGIGVLHGGLGNDSLVGAGVMDGGSSSGFVGDLYYSAWQNANTTIDLSSAAAQTIFTGFAYPTVTFVDIESLSTGNGNDVLTGNALSNYFNPNGGDDTVNGGAGYDSVDYVNAVVGVTVNLNLQGAPQATGQGNDTLISIERVFGSQYDDTLTGDAGDNGFSGGAGTNVIDGGGGFDWVTYSAAAGGVTVDLSNTGVQNTSFSNDQLLNIEMVIGSEHNDHLTGNSGDNALDGGGGDDILDGGAGIDTANYNGGPHPLGVVVNLSIAGPQDTVGAGVDTLISIENISGSNFNDVLTGDGAANELNGWMGDDIINGGGGDDLIRGDANNALNQDPHGSDGNDTLHGDAGDDTLMGGGGDDTLDGGAGNDTASYAESVAAVTANLATGTATGEGTDTLLAIENLTGSAFNDTLTGDAGNNVLDGGPGGVDQIHGGAGTDTVSYAHSTSGVSIQLDGQITWDGTSVDFLDSIENAIGSAQNDTLLGDAGNNVLDGGTGGADAIYGGAGTDTVSYASSTTGVSIQLDSQVTWDGVAMDFLNSIENAIGSAQNDTLLGDAGNNVLDGGTGGSDAIYGGAGSDTVSYAHSTSGVSIQLDSQVAWDGVAMDFLNSIENAIGSAQDDTLLGDAGNNVLDGGVGGSDAIYGGAGSDTVSYASSTHGVSIQLDGQVSWDGTSMDFLNSIENAIGSAQDDTLLGDAGNNVLDGGSGGSDAIYGGAGSDTVSYASSTHGVNIQLDGQVSWDGTSMDFLNSIENAIGSAQDDTLLGDGGNNVLDGGAGGADAIYGGAGSDTVSYASSTHGVSIQLDGQVSWDGVTMDFLNSIENAIGSSHDDTLIGDGGDNVLDGGAGGADAIFGGGGSDTVSYASSTHGVSIQLDSQVSWDGTTMDFLNSIENAIGSSQDDTLFGDAGDNVLDGGAGGLDSIYGGGGTDTVSYASSNHGVTILLDSQITWDGTTMDFLSSIENGKGSSFDDYLQGSSGDNVLTGGGGNDTLVGGDGIDTIVLSGVLGDYIFTQVGADAYTVTDTVNGRDGTDTFSGIEFVLFGDGTTHPPPDLIV